MTARATFEAPVLIGADAATLVMVYVVVLYAIPSRLVIEPLGSAGAPSMVLGLVGFVVWALYRMSRPIAAVRIDETRPVRKALVFFVICCCISFIFAMTRPIDADEVSPAVVALLSVLSWSGMLLLANDEIASLSRLNTVARGLAWAGGLLGLLGLIQFMTGDILIDRISIPGLRAVDFEVFQRDGFTRPSATATHPIEFGVIIAMMLPFALHLAFHGTSRHRLIRWLPALVLGVSMALTFSRSAYVSFGVALVILLVGWPARRRLNVGGVLVALCAVLFAAVPHLFGTITALFRNVGNDPSIASRTDSYDLAFEFIFQSPLFGRGLGTFLPKYRIFDNQYLGLLVGVGLVGTFAMVVLFAAGMRVSLQGARSGPDPANRDLGLTIAASVAAGTTSLATFDAFAFPMTMGTLFLVMGLGGALYRLTGSPKWTRSRAEVLAQSTSI